jgi:hypothetical protein
MTSENTARELERPDDCAICYNKMTDVKPLECGHWIHLECVKKHFKPECPMCRRKLNIQVTGSLPEAFIPLEAVPDLNTLNTLVEQIEYYSYREDMEYQEDEYTDEENPYGDDYDYPDEEE